MPPSVQVSVSDDGAERISDQQDRGSVQFRDVVVLLLLRPRELGGFARRVSVALDNDSQAGVEGENFAIEA